MTPIICAACRQLANVLYRLPDEGQLKWLCWACYPAELRDTGPARITIEDE